MKIRTLIILASLSTLFLQACEVTIVEPVYDIRNDYVGIYEVDEFSDTYGHTTYYTWDIVKSRDINGLWIRNFYAANIDVFAEVSGDRLRIPYQEVNGFVIEGSGFIYGRELELNYYVKDLTARNLPADFCSTIAFR